MSQERWRGSDFLFRHSGRGVAKTRNKAARESANLLRIRSLSILPEQIAFGASPGPSFARPEDDEGLPDQVGQ